jgi:hypothetical protein
MYNTDTDRQQKYLNVVLKLKFYYSVPLKCVREMQQLITGVHLHPHL